MIIIGVNDALLGAAIGDLSANVFNAFANHAAQQREKSIIELKDMSIGNLTQLNEINAKNAKDWKARALEAEENRDEWKAGYQQAKTKSDNRLIELMEKSGSFNKSEAMREALREGIDKLFEEGHVDYDKEQFDHEVNDNYIQKRLTLDKATKENFKDYGGGEGWLPDEDYMNNDFADFK